MTKEQLAEKERKDKENRLKEERMKRAWDFKQKPKPTGDDPKAKRARNGDKEDLFDVHNFDIEIDVNLKGNVGTPANVIAPPVAAGAMRTGGVGADGGAKALGGPSKRSLNLADYKKKRGLI